MTAAALPLVAVPADVCDFDRYRWHASPETYLAAVARVAGAVPVVVPALGDERQVEALLARVDGVLVTGAVSNVHPARYGAAATERHRPFDPDRDALTERLIAGALGRGLPLLAICRGLQELNVARGGSLAIEIQELEGRLDHRAPEHPEQAQRFALRQDVAVEGAALRAIVGTETLRVNSLHRQAIDRLGDGLAVEARAPDGTVEAVSVADAPGFALGVQWHPEYFAETDPASGAIFAAFGDACRAYAAQRNG